MSVPSPEGLLSGSRCEIAQTGPFFDNPGIRGLILWETNAA